MKMTSLIAILILGFVVVIGSVSMGVVFSTVIKAFITKAETTVKKDTVSGYDKVKADVDGFVSTDKKDAVSEYDKVKADVDGFINRTETNVKASILDDPAFLKSLNDKLKAIVK